MNIAMSYLKQNLSVLQRRQPELIPLLEGVERSAETTIERTPQGGCVHRHRGRLLHSLRAPLTEARLWVERWPQGAPVFGFADGYHLEALLEARGPSGPITVLEPDIELFRTVLEDRDLTGLLDRLRIEPGLAPAQAADRIRDEAGRFALHVYPPVGQLQGRYLEALQALAAHGDREAFRLRILVVGPIYGGSYPIARHVEQALRELGHEVEFVDLADFHPGYAQVTAWDRDGGLVAAFEEMVSGLVEERNRAFAPDLLLALAQAPLRDASMRRIREGGTRIAYWFVEDYRRMPYWRQIAPETDAFFMIQREGQQEVRAAGTPCVAYLPLAALTGTHEPRILSPEDHERFGSVCAFMGAGYPNRRSLLKGVADLGLSIWGNEWDGTGWPLAACIREGGRRLTSEETVKVFNATRVNINLHSSTYHDGVDPYGDFVNPRTFELAGCEAFQLVDPRSLLPEVFTEKEVVRYHDLPDLREKILHYRDHPSEREAIAARARRRVLREHTYALRMQELLGTLYAQGLEPRDRGRTVRDWLAEARTPALRAFLSRFPPDEVVALDTLVDDIRKKETLDEADRVFLTLAAFKDEARCSGS